MFHESVTTIKGMHLNAKVQAGICLMRFTKVKLGNGVYADEVIKEELNGLLNTKQEVLISKVTIVGEDTVKINAVITNEGVNEGFYISEMGVYAEDPDEGEILYSIATGVNGKMDYHPSYSEMKNYSLSVDTYITVSNTEKVIIKTQAGAVASAEELEKLNNPEFDDSGNVEGIIDFNTFLDTLVSKMSIFDFFGNLKAGLKYVLHTDQIVNDCSTDNPSVPLSATQGKVLMELYQNIRSTQVIYFPVAAWGLTAPFTQNVMVPGVTAEDTPIIALHLPTGTNHEGEKAAKKAYSCISWVDTGPGTITATCLGKKPATDIYITIKGV